MIRALADGLWHWTARHPEWHPRTEFGARVGSYLAHEGRRAWFRRVGVPRLAPLLQIDFDRALVTHGEPVMEGAHRALEDAFDADPWYHRPS